jgi:hypothetical protein
MNARRFISRIGISSPRDDHGGYGGYGYPAYSYGYPYFYGYGYRPYGGFSVGFGFGRRGWW